MEWNGSKESRMKGVLTIDTESASQHLQFPTSSDFYTALQGAASHGPVPIKLFCDNTSPMTDIAEAMRRGLNSKNTLLGHLFCNVNSLYTSKGELPPYISEGNKCQLKAYKILREHRVALVQGLPGSGKTRLILNILKRCQHLKATWLAETNDTCEMQAYKAKRAGLSPVLLLAKGRGTPKNLEL